MQSLQGGKGIGDHLKGLRYDRAIKDFRRNRDYGGKVADNRGACIPGVDVKDVTSLHALAPAAARICVVTDLKYPTAYGAGVCVEKTLDVVAIDRQAAIKSEATTHRFHTSQTAPIQIHFNRYTTTVVDLQDAVIFPESSERNLEDRLFLRQIGISVRIAWCSSRD